MTAAYMMSPRLMGGDRFAGGLSVGLFTSPPVATPSVDTGELQKLYRAWDTGDISQSTFRSRIQDRYPQLDATARSKLEKTTLGHAIPFKEVVKVVRAGAVPYGSGISGVVSSSQHPPMPAGMPVGVPMLSPRLEVKQSDITLQQPQATGQPPAGQRPRPLTAHTGVRIRSFHDDAQSLEVCWAHGEKRADTFDQMVMSCNNRTSFLGGIQPRSRACRRAVSPSPERGDDCSPIFWNPPEKDDISGSNPARTARSLSPSITAYTGDRPHGVLRGAVDPSGKPVPKVADHRTLLNWDKEGEKVDTLRTRRHYQPAVPVPGAQSTPLSPRNGAAGLQSHNRHDGHSMTNGERRLRSPAGSRLANFGGEFAAEGPAKLHPNRRPVSDLRRARSPSNGVA